MTGLRIRVDLLLLELALEPLLEACFSAGDEKTLSLQKDFLIS